MIKELHCCNNCKHEIAVPKDPEHKSFEPVCIERRKEHKVGGLTDCPIYTER